MTEKIVNELKDTNKVIAIGLLIILGMSLFKGSNELSMSIASGLIGFMSKSSISKE